MARVSVIVFPGSNCDHDVAHAFSLVGGTVSLCWHQETDLKNPDLVVLPGGFSYGDYLRTGALAKLSPAMGAVRAFAERGGRVLGICNGFQILCEAGLLPGALLQNVGCSFISRFVHLSIDSPESFVTRSVSRKAVPSGATFCCPIAHGEGNFFADSETMKRIEGEGLVVFRYCDPEGRVDPDSRESNPNGSCGAIAGIRNERGNVVGLMPHPERAIEELVGGVGGASCRELIAACVTG